MERTKLYFNFTRNVGDNIEVIANNHIDLENWLKAKYDIKITALNVSEDEAEIKTPNDTGTYFAEIKWITHI